MSGTTKPRWQRVLAGGARVFLTAYGVLVIIALLLRWFVGEERWMGTALLNQHLNLILLPSALFLPLSVVLRWPRIALLISPALIVSFLFYGVYFTARPVVLPDGATTFSLLTYNLQAEEDLLEPMAALIREANADIVVLQELSSTAAEYFMAELSDLYPHHALHPVSSPYHGRGIFSRFAVVSDHAWPERFPVPVRLQRLELDIQGDVLTLYNFHAPPSLPIFQGPYDVRPRRQQIAGLLALAREDSGAVILAGDFNTTDTDENYAIITANFRDSFREAGWGFGYTNPDWQHDNPRRGSNIIPPYSRVDYVFHNDAVVSVETRTWSHSGGSDHRPVYAVLALKPEEVNP